MSNLIKVDQSGKTTARELYDFLGLRSGDYSRWCKNNIEDNQFAEEGVDYSPFRMNAERGAQATTNYNLSIDFAKKLCMVSKSERGEQARNYFIEVEKRYISQNSQSSIKFTPAPRPRTRMISTAVKDVNATAKLISKLYGVKDGIANATALKLVEEVYQMDMSPLKKLLPATEEDTGRLNATQIADRLNIRYSTGSPDPKTINKMLISAGLMVATSNKKQPYDLTDAGKIIGEIVPYTRGGHSGYEVRWNSSVIELLKESQTL